MCVCVCVCVRACVVSLLALGFFLPLLIHSVAVNDSIPIGDKSSSVWRKRRDWAALLSECARVQTTWPSDGHFLSSLAITIQRFIHSPLDDAPPTGVPLTGNEQTAATTFVCRPNT